MTHTELANSLKESAVDAWVVSESGYDWMISGRLTLRAVLDDCVLVKQETMNTVARFPTETMWAS